MLKSPTARWIAGAAGLCVVLLGLTYLVLVGPRRDEAAALTDQTAAAEQENTATQLRTTQLRALYATLPQRRADLTAMLAQLPVTADMPGFVRSLDGMADSSGVQLTGVTPGPAGYLTAAGTPATGAAGAAAPAAAPGAGGVVTPVAVPVNLVVKGPYFKAVTFLQKLQSGQRAFLVTGLQVTVAADSGVTLTVKGSIFALPGAAAALQAASPDAQPAAAGAPAPAPAATAPAGAAGGATAGATAGAAPGAVAQGQAGPGSVAPSATPMTSPPHVATAPPPAGATGSPR